MKISIIVQDRFHAFDYAREFHRLGHLHQLITPYPKHITSRYGVPSNKVISLLYLGAIQRLLQHLSFSQQMKNTLEVWWLETYAMAAAQALKECDVLIAWSSVGAPAFKKARQWGTLCICERGSSHILTQERLLREEHQLVGVRWTEWTNRKRRLELNDYDLADLIEVPSGFARSTFLENGVLGSRVIQSAYGVDLTSFRGDDISKANSFRVLYVGSLTLRKGIHYLTQGFKDANLRNAELWLVGHSSYETNLLIDNNDPQIRRMGHVSQTELRDVYAQASVFVIASVEEGLAMVQVQSLACGLPLICTLNSGGEDLLKLSGKEPSRLDDDILQYSAGFVVPIRRPDCIARCLRILNDNHDLLTRMRKEAISISTSTMDWSYVASRLADVYQSIRINN